MRKLMVPVLLTILLLSLVTQWYTALSIFLTAFLLFCMVDKFGKGILLLETISLYSCIIYLIMPLFGYSVYNKQSRISVIWLKVMPVTFDTYYGFVLPAITAFLLGMFIWMGTRRKIDEGENLYQITDLVTSKLSGGRNVAFILIIIGMCFYVIKRMLPQGLSAVGNFFYLLIFPGLLYIRFQPKFRGKPVIYVIVILFILRDAISTSMFTVLFYMGITMTSFFVLRKRINLLAKISLVVLAVSGIFILQLAKISLRLKTKSSNYAGSKTELFQDLLIEKAGSFSDIFSANSFFPIYVRLNQGFNTALVLKRIPYYQPYDEGESIVNALAGSVVPRIVWPDKPESGGVYNMKHFAGWSIKGWSVNIGPVGEAYGNFGVNGGIFYMFLFGLAIGGAYKIVFTKAKKIPLLLLWFPLLFYEVMFCMENDTFQAMNSLSKGAIFVWILMKLFPQLFLYKKNDYNAKRANSHHIGNNGTGWSLPGAAAGGQGV